MRTTTAGLALGSAILLTACAGTQKPELSPELASVDCSNISGEAVSAVYEPGSVKKVTPLYRTEFIARAIQPTYVSGAELQIPAQANLNDAYLQRALSCRAASHARAGITGDANDPLAVPGVERIRVRSVGPNTAISVTSSDRDAAKQILERARDLKRGTVDVQQLSSAVVPDTATF